MSWSVSYLGKPAAVIEAVRKEIANPNPGVSGEPEAGARLAILETVIAVATSYVGGNAIQVTASGSQWKDGDTVKSHTCGVTINPLYGFVE